MLDALEFRISSQQYENIAENLGANVTTSAASSATSSSTTSSAPATPTVAASESHGVSAAPIVGGVLGAVLGLGLMALGVYLVVRRRRQAYSKLVDAGAYIRPGPVRGESRAHLFAVIRHRHAPARGRENCTLHGPRSPTIRSTGNVVHRSRGIGSWFCGSRHVHCGSNLQSLPCSLDGNGTTPTRQEERYSGSVERAGTSEAENRPREYDVRNPLGSSAHVLSRCLHTLSFACSVHMTTLLPLLSGVVLTQLVISHVSTQ